MFNNIERVLGQWGDGEITITRAKDEFYVTIYRIDRLTVKRTLIVDHMAESIFDALEEINIVLERK